MIVSDAMRAANRQNAQQSTGPRTEAGKEASSRNAVRHGLAAAKPVDAAEAREQAARAAALRAVFGPADEWQGWLVEELANATLRLTRIARVEVELRADAAWRAEHLWDEDRRLDAERIGATLHRDPARALVRLRRTPHGCDWLIGRWAALYRAAEEAGTGAWSAEHAELARDLLGTPPAFRPGPIAADGRVAGIAPGPAELARAQVAELQAHRAVVAEGDESARDLAIAGLADAPTRDLANLRRYERAALRRLGWIKDQMDQAGLRPQPQSNFNHAATPAPTPTVDEDPIPARTPDDQRIERNEPASARVPGETGPTPDLATPPPATEARPKRPDLDKFRRRNRRSA